jgi:hypothetical protein
MDYLFIRNALNLGTKSAHQATLRAHVQACSVCRAVAEVEVAVVGVEEGEADSGKDLVDPVCVPNAGIVCLM